MKLETISISNFPWDKLYQFEDHNVFQTLEWIRYLEGTQGAEPILAQISESGTVIGYFTGLIVRRMGMKILGSPFTGWGTAYMGFNLMPGIQRTKALHALTSFAFHDLGCVHLEVCDRYITREEGLSLGYRSQEDHWYESDLTAPEEKIFKRMRPSYRSNVRKALRCGVIVEEAQDIQFAADYYDQAVEVFARQSLVPNFDKKRIEKLIHYMLPTGRLLMLRAREPSGTCIATGLWLSMNKLGLFWGNASLRTYQHFRANQALHWYAIRYLKRRGMHVLSWGGGKYKEQYGVEPILYSRLMRSKYGIIPPLRSVAQTAHNWKQRITAALNKNHREPSTDGVENLEQGAG